MSQEILGATGGSVPSASHRIRRVTVVGAGPSGLIAAKSLREESLDPVICEQANGVGGQWYGPSAHSGVWPGMRANTSKTLDTFSDFPPAKSLPMFPRVEALCDHLRDYAQAFDLHPMMCLATPIRCLQRHNGRWQVFTRFSAYLPLAFPLHDDILVAQITLCQNWLAYVVEGRIRCRPTIVAATGYDLSLPFLPEDVRRTLDADATDLDLYVHTFHPDLPGLAFVGQHKLIGPYVPCIVLLTGGLDALGRSGFCPVRR